MTRKEVRSQMIAGIDKKELAQLKFSKATAKKELIWEHSKEFEYRGNMYDVIETEFNGDSIIYWCWWDNEETILNRQLSNLVLKALGSNPQNKENEKQLTEFFKTLFHNDILSIDVVSFPFDKDKRFSWVFTYISCFNVPSVPPPEIV